LVSFNFVWWEKVVEKEKPAKPKKEADEFKEKPAAW